MPSLTLATSALNATSIEVKERAENIMGQRLYPDNFRPKEIKHTTKDGSVQTTITTIYKPKLEMEAANVISSLKEYETLLAYGIKIGRQVNGEDENSSIAAAASKLEASLRLMSENPENLPARVQLLEDIKNFTTSLNNAASSVQKLRTEADETLAKTADEINIILTSLQTNNQKMTQAHKSKSDQSDLIRERVELLSKLSEHMEISIYEREEGTIAVFSKSGEGQNQNIGGIPMLNPAPSKVRFIHNTVYPNLDINNGLSRFEIVLNEGQANEMTIDLGANIIKGKIKALLSLRDQQLPQIQQTLDDVAGVFVDSINAAHNNGAGYPAPSRLTSRLDVAAADLPGWTGDVKIAAVSANGVITNEITINLNGKTVQQVIDELNANNGGATPGNQFNAQIINGKLVIKTVNEANNGIAINELSSDVGGKGFSHHLGLNNIIEGTPGVGCANSLMLDARFLEQNPFKYLAVSALDPAAAIGQVGITQGGIPHIMGNDRNTPLKLMFEVFSKAKNFANTGLLGADSQTINKRLANLREVCAGTTKNNENRVKYDGEYQKNLNAMMSKEYGFDPDKESLRIATLKQLYFAISRIINSIIEMQKTVIDSVTVIR